MSSYRSLSIVIPVFNELNSLTKVLEQVSAADTCGLEKEIIIVDDCSTDGTKAILKGIENRYRVYYQSQNQGKGAAVRRGLAMATGDLVMVQDADLEYNPSEYPTLLQPILEDRADVVYGSRFLGLKQKQDGYISHKIGNMVLTRISNWFTGFQLTDMETCYKLFRRDIIQRLVPNLHANRFGFEPEVTGQISRFAKRQSCRLVEVPISYSARSYVDGKKIRWRDGVAALWFIITNH